MVLEHGAQENVEPETSVRICVDFSDLHDWSIIDFTKPSRQLLGFI